MFLRSILSKSIYPMAIQILFNGMSLLLKNEPGVTFLLGKLIAAKVKLKSLLLELLTPDFPLYNLN